MVDNENNTNNGVAQEQISQQETRELDACMSQVQEWKNRSLQIAADFENFKKRADRSQDQWMVRGQVAVLADFLPVIDNLERALVESRKKMDQEKSHSLVAGLEMVLGAVNKLLEKYNVEPMDHLTTFDPTFCQAVAQVESPDYTSGMIVEILQKGYLHNGVVLRPAVVTVAK